jgi:hypothetical protein
VRPVRADLSEAYAAFAQRVKRKYFEDSPQTILSAHGGFLVGDIYSFLCGGRSEDWRQSQARVRKILGFQNRKGYFRIEGLELNHRHVVPFLYVQALWEFARLFPQEPLAGKVRDALARFMATVERLTSLSSFGHMADYSDAVSPLLIPRAYAGHGLNSYYAGTANVCLLVGDLLGTRRFVPVAERQMQWVFGRNPCGVCSMGGEGYRRGLLHDITLFYQGKERSTLPGVVPLGISGGDGVAYPLDYPKCSNRPVEGERDGYSVAWSNGEPAYFVMGPVCLALGLLSQRLR